MCLLFEDCPERLPGNDDFITGQRDCEDDEFSGSFLFLKNFKLNYGGMI